MKLKSIRLMGFKSFADETIIQVQNAMTCVVGPNGCGKSNILDALRWVLGEKSAKGLRGQQMEDLIFMGSAQRKPAGMAEVEICFDNKGRTIEIDQDEVTIGRRLYVSSASEYYINGKRSTRRDLEKILLDTGIGKSAYSIIEQGKISEILRATPEVRRELLDEAAGIARFKWERSETLKKLSETEQNLLRVNDIWKAKRREIENLEKQAIKTRRYIELKAISAKHDRSLRYFTITNLNASLEIATKQLQTLKEKRENELKKIKELESQKQQIEENNRSLQEETHSLDKNFHKDKAALNTLENRKGRLQKDHQERQSRLTELGKRIEEEEKKLKGLETKINDTKQLQLTLANDLEQLKTKALEFEKDLQNIANEIKENHAKEESNEKEIHTKEKEHATHLKDLKDLAHKLIIELDAKKKDLQSREGLRVSIKEKLEEKLLNNETLLQEISKLLKNNLNTISATEWTQITQNINHLSNQKLTQDFQNYEAIEKEFRSFFFDPSGLLARKENLELGIQNLSNQMTEIKEDIRNLQMTRKKLQTQKDEKKAKIHEINLHVRDFQSRQESQKEQLKQISYMQKEITDRISYFQKDKKTHSDTLHEIEKEQKEIVTEYSAAQKRVGEQEKRLEQLKPLLTQKKADIEKVNQQIIKIRQGAEDILPQISKQERTSEQIQVQLTQGEQGLYNDYQISFDALSKEIQNANIDFKKEEAELIRIQKEIQELGTTNALAIEELERSQKEIKLLEEQRKDIEIARDNIQDALKDVDQRSLQIFQETFTIVQEKFEKVFDKLFGGGKAYLKLTDPENILSSGIDIMVQPPGKKNSSIALLSGGEQTLSAVALIFGIYLVRPSPFCFLDEIDAPLDDSNVRLFLEMLKEYTPNTQFLVISHNKMTMVAADAIFGVTQEEAGVSQIVSVKLTENEAKAIPVKV